MSENTSSIATSRPTRATRGTTAAASSNKTTATTDTKQRGSSVKKNGVGVARKKGKGKGKEQVYCVCREKDYGTPMICCGACREWYHFSCLGLEQEDAEDVEVYICGPCSLDTGLRTARDWEGPEGLEGVDEATLAAQAEELKSTRTYEPEPVRARVPPPPPESESEDDDSSSDEYVADGKGDPRRTAAKRRIRRMASSDEDEDVSDDEEGDSQPKAKRSRLSRGKARSTESPGPGQSSSSKLKRKQSVAEGNPPAKKSKTSGGPNDDPTRKYCLGKLQEIFSNIFLTFPYFPPEDSIKTEGDAIDALGPNATRPVSAKWFTKATTELTEEEKSQLEEKAKAYATQAEAAVFEAHAEFDKAGIPSAAGKYKERFRMLDFNLKKPDRAVLHKRIVSSAIPPAALAHMSSTDLASEAEKESIKQAEQEALEHSILQKVVAPRAKVTHKGLQDIEDIDGRPVVRDIDLDKEIEEEERRERERTARMRMRSGTLTSGSGSVPPESPIVPDHPSSVGWGGPPPIPFHLQQSPVSPLATERPPLFTQTQSELLTPTNGQVEGELNLADLINIDDDGHDSIMAIDTSPTLVGTGVNADDGPESSITGIPQSPVVPQSARPTGISPFAVNTSQPDLTIRPSFDLNSVWSAPASSPKKQEDNEEVIGGPDESGKPLEPPPDHGKELELKDPFVDDDILGGAAAADDKDFDMFLEAETDGDSLQGRSTSANPPPDVSAKEPSFCELPQVWLGSLNMPLESNTPTEIPVLARQIGGRSLEHDSPLWKTLFPSVQLRIDGRVPIDRSAQFLLQMRMNSSKELVAVAFSPPNEQQNGPFKFLIDYLLGKNRHGLVFPWGTKPKEYHPGRELYIIPLLSSEPLPDYVELLDSLRLPKTRTKDYLIGVWILNKGKLVAPPAPTPLPPTPTLQTSTPGLASIISQLQFTTPNPSFGAPPPPPSISPPSIPGLPPIAPPPVSGSPINPALLAAEVASLTPDQIQRMLQSLTQVGSGPVPPPIPQQSPPPIPPSSNGHGSPPPWINGPPPPGPPGVYPPYPPNVGQHQLPVPGLSPPPLHPHQQPPYHPPGPPPPHRPPYPGGPGGSYENHDQFDGPGYERNRYERAYVPPPRAGRGRPESGGWRGRGGGKDKGGRDRDRDRGDRQRDSGWPKRGGRGGGPGWGERPRT